MSDFPRWDILIIRRSLKAYLADRGDVAPEEPLFTGQSGKDLSRVRVWQILNAAAVKIGLKHIGTHTLRYVGIEQEQLNAAYLDLNL